MIKIAPSILSADFANLGRDIQRIETADYVHVDVMDGLFVPNISIGIPVVKSIRPVTDLPLDVHLMIDRPEPGFTPYRTLPGRSSALPTSYSSSVLAWLKVQISRTPALLFSPS